jgi:hypothetical protein
MTMPSEPVCPHPFNANNNNNNNKNKSATYITLCVPHMLTTHPLTCKVVYCNQIKMFGTTTFSKNDSVDKQTHTRKTVFDLQTRDVDEITSNALLKVGQLFPKKLDS